MVLTSYRALRESIRSVRGCGWCGGQWWAGWLGGQWWRAVLLAAGFCCTHARASLHPYSRASPVALPAGPAWPCRGGGAWCGAGWAAWCGAWCAGLCCCLVCGPLRLLSLPWLVWPLSMLLCCRVPGVPALLVWLVLLSGLVCCAAGPAGVCGLCWCGVLLAVLCWRGRRLPVLPVLSPCLLCCPCLCCYHCCYHCCALPIRGTFGLSSLCCAAPA